MDDAILQRLDERTDNLIKVIDKHVDDDKRKFEGIYDRLRGLDVNVARGGVIIGAVIVLAQVIVGAWIKGLF